MKPVEEPSGTAIRLEDLIARMTPENQHPLIDFGPPVGREIGWELPDDTE